MHFYEKLILVSGITLAAVCLSTMAGPTNLKNEKAVKQRQAEVTIAVDPDAGVTYASIKAELEAVGTALDAVTTALDAIDMTTIDPAVFTGTQKTCIQNLKGNLNSLRAATKDLRTAAKNNMQASNRLVRKLKESERIEREAK